MSVVDVLWSSAQRVIGNGEPERMKPGHCFTIEVNIASLVDLVPLLMWIVAMHHQRDGLEHRRVS